MLDASEYYRILPRRERLANGKALGSRTTLQLEPGLKHEFGIDSSEDERRHPERRRNKHYNPLREQYATLAQTKQRLARMGLHSPGGLRLKSHTGSHTSQKSSKAAQHTRSASPTSRRPRISLDAAPTPEFMQAYRARKRGRRQDSQAAFLEQTVQELASLPQWLSMGPDSLASNGAGNSPGVGITQHGLAARQCLASSFVNSREVIRAGSQASVSPPPSPLPPYQLLPQAPWHLAAQPQVSPAGASASLQLQLPPALFSPGMGQASRPPGTWSLQAPSPILEQQQQLQPLEQLQRLQHQHQQRHLEQLEHLQQLQQQQQQQQQQFEQLKQQQVQQQQQLPTERQLDFNMTVSTPQSYTPYHLLHDAAGTSSPGRCDPPQGARHTTTSLSMTPSSTPRSHTQQARPAPDPLPPQRMSPLGSTRLAFRQGVQQPGNGGTLASLRALLQQITAEQARLMAYVPTS